MPRPARKALNVFLNARLVGRLLHQSNGAIEFQYHQSWLDWENALPVSYSLPLREDRYVGEPVIAVFDNLIPDNEQIRHRLAERSGADGDDAYSLLAAIGRDCVGALQFLPDGDDPGEAGKIEGRRIGDDEIAKVLTDLKQTPLGVDRDSDFRISIAGAQDKTALLFWDGHWLVPHGTTATSHIFKPEIGKLPNGIDMSQSIENEHLCMLITAAFGLDTARTEIKEFNGCRVLVIERFDRLHTKDHRLLRVPQEDCCQALSVPPSRKYESHGGPGIPAILGLLEASDVMEQDRRTFLKTQILYWLMAAPDGHAKNFSIFLLPGGRFHLTPLYDVMSAQPNLDKGEIQQNKLKLAMAVGDTRHYAINTIAPRHFVQTAKKAGMPRSQVEPLFDEIRRTAEGAITKVQDQLPKAFPEEIAASVFDGLRQRLRLLDQAM